MKRSRSDFLLTLCSLSACLGVVYLAAERATEPDLQPTPPSGTPLPEPSAAKARELESKVAELTRNLNRTTTQLNEAMARLSEDAGEVRRAAAVEEAMAQTPAPRLLTLGPEGSQVPHFDELPAPSGQSLATDVRYHGIYGRRLVFRDAVNRPKAFDVEEVHPGVLAHLGIDVNDATEAGHRAEERRRARAEAAAQRRAERAQALAAEQARQNHPAPIADASMSAPTTQTTHITINQPAPAQPVYTTPVYYHWNYPVRRTPVRRNPTPWPTSGFHFNVGPVSASVAPTANWVGSDAARFPYNQGFRFNQTGPYTTIPR